jgi:hypothetical protein
MERGETKMKKLFLGTMLLTFVMVVPIAAMAGGDIHVSFPLRPPIVVEAPSEVVPLPVTNDVYDSTTLLAGLAFAQLETKNQPKPTVRKFYSVLDLKQQGTGSVLIGGREAKSTDFPASFYSLSDSGSCTSTMVSSRALLTAAHCVDPGGEVSLTLNIGTPREATYGGICTHSPDYDKNKTADWALCLLSKEITGIPFERINMDESRIRVGSELLLTGFGCVTSAGTGGNDGVYRIGEANVTSLPTGSSNDIVTKGMVALCFGDSGGPAFLFLDTNKRDRIVVSVNSRGNIRETSYLSSTSTNLAKAFFMKWSQDNGVKLCGVHSDAPNCRVPK